MNITELIAKAIDSATVFDAEGRLVWLNATVDYDPQRLEDTVVVTADPDFGRTVRLAVREIQ